MKNIYWLIVILLVGNVRAASVDGSVYRNRPDVQPFAEFLRTHRALMDPTKAYYEKGVVLMKLKPEVAAIPHGALTCGVSNIDAKLISVGAFKIYNVFNRISPAKGVTTTSTVDDPLSRIYAIHYLANQDPVDVAEALALDPNVEYAEPSPIRRVTSCEANDYLDPDNTQFQIKIMNVPDAWAVNPVCDNTGVIMAIVDSGVDLTHEDLKNLLWVNPDEGNNWGSLGITNDHNGVDLVGSVSEADALNGNFSPDGDPTPGKDHGTHVAGCADAQVNNGVGICGTAYNSPLMSIKCGIDDPNSDYIFRGYVGIQWAADHGASIINCSWGGQGISQAEQDVVDYAFDTKNAVVVAAAGNSSSDNDITPFGPASLDRLLSVGAIQYDGTTGFKIVPASFSDMGTSVRTWAPGYNVTSCLPTVNGVSPYDMKSGTSMASPIAAGVAAIIRATHPNFTPDQVVEQAHVNSTIPVLIKGNPSRIKYYGMLDAYQAVSNDLLPGMIITNVTSAVASDTVPLQVTLKNILIGKSQNLSATLSLASPNSNIVIGGSPTRSYGMLSTNESKAQSYTIYLQNGVTRTVGKFLLTLLDGTFADYIQFTATIEHSGVVAWNLNESVPNLLYSVKGINDNLAWAVGGNDASQTGQIFHTIDGSIWTQEVTTSGTTAVSKQTLYCVEAVLAQDQSQRAWAGSKTAGTKKAAIYYSTYDTAGYKWNPVDVSAITPFVHSIHFTNASQGVFIGDPVGGKWGIGTTVDGGRTWLPLATPVTAAADTAWNNGADWVGTTGWFGTSSNQIYKTTDNGMTWSASTAPFSRAQGIAFTNAQTGLAYFNPTTGTGSATMARSIDGGATWTTISGPSVNNARFSGIAYSKGSPTVWICGYQLSGGTEIQDFVYVSNNNGSSWTKQTTPPGKYQPQGMAIGLGQKKGTLPQNLSGWFVGKSIVDYNQQFTVGVKDQPTGVINQQTMQCYPNPFSDRTLLQATIGNARRAVSLKIFNAIGQTVADLSGQLGRGDQSLMTAMFDATSLTEGMYFALLKLSDGSAISTRLSVVKP